MDPPATIREPALEQSGERVYFTDRDGARWRVCDVCFGPPHCARGRRHGARPPDPRANYRWFVAADGTERCLKLEGECAVTGLARHSACAYTPADSRSILSARCGMRESKFTEFLTAINSAESEQALERLERRVRAEQNRAGSGEDDRARSLLEKLHYRRQRLQAREQ